mgnify:FL=1
MLPSARFHDMCCFTCTYAYVRACVTSENKAFMLVPMPSLRWLHKSCALLVWLVKLGFLRIFKTYVCSLLLKRKKK